MKADRLFDERTACPECGHSLYKHRENMTTSRTAIGDPVECFAALYVDTPDGLDFNGLCRCRWLIENTTDNREEQSCPSTG